MGMVVGLAVSSERAWVFGFAITVSPEGSMHLAVIVSVGEKWPILVDIRSFRKVTLLQLQSDPVVHRVPEALLAAQVSFSCLHRDVPQQKLDLFKLTARGVAQAGARAATVMG
jgi:hypothetical protein